METVGGRQDGKIMWFTFKTQCVQKKLEKKSMNYNTKDAVTLMS